jgi:integrase
MRMAATLDHGLRGLRDRAILLIGFAGGLRRSEITGLDCGPDREPSPMPLRRSPGVVTHHRARVPIRSRKQHVPTRRGQGRGMTGGKCVPKASTKMKKRLRYNRLTLCYHKAIATIAITFH